MTFQNVRIRKLISFLIFFTAASSNAQPAAEARYYQATVAFYNLENLFDTINDIAKDDEEFLPSSPKQWTNNKFRDKLEKLSSVLEKLGDDDGPEIIGVAEVENKFVLEQLINTEKLKGKGYEIAHIESPDNRGIDVGLLYKKKYFKPFSVKNVDVIDSADPGFKTRNLLVVSGVLSNDTVTFIVNHWPSRRGGGKDEKRLAASKCTRRTVDSLIKKNTDAKIILMGDFNDDPSDRSIFDYLDAKPEKKLKDKSLFNPMYSIHKSGYGTLRYNGAWNLFDQIILSQPLLKSNKYYYLKNSASIFYKKWLLNKDGKDEGAPKRTWSGTEYIGGYSDHLPVYIYLVQKVS